MTKKTINLTNLLWSIGVILILFAFGHVEPMTTIGKEALAQTQWKTNPIIQLPTEGCFTGVWRGDYGDIAGKEKEVY